MSEILLAGLKIGYLALLWLFILVTANVIRTDLFGRRVTASELPVEDANGAAVAGRGRRKGRKQQPPAPQSPSGGASAAPVAPSSPSRLIVTNGPQLGMAAEVAESGTYVVIGRGHDCAIVLDDDYASTHHARVVNGRTGFYIEDLGSTNGSYVNGRRITSPTTVGLSDEIRIGRTILKLEP